MKLTIRPARATDQRFVAATWSNNWKRPDEIGLLAPAPWREAIFRSVEVLLARPGVRVLVAADADSVAGDADIFGYLALYEAAGEPLPLVLFCYVKPGARRSGLARALFRRAGLDPAAPFPYACHTRCATELREAGKTPHATWRPELGRLTNPHERTDHVDD